MLENELGVLNSIYRGYEEEVDKNPNGYKIGSSITIRRPADFTVRTGATMNVQDVLEGGVPLTVDTQKGVDFQFSSTELTLSIEELSERVIQPAMSSLVNDIASDIFTTMYKGAYEFVGTMGTAIDSYAKFARFPTRMDHCATPTVARKVLLHTDDNWGMIGQQTQLYSGSPGLVNQAYTEGNLGKVAGCDTYSSQVAPTHTVGPLGGTPAVNDTSGSQNVTYNTAKDTWSQSLITDGWTASAAARVKAGDSFTIATVYKVNPKTKATTAILQDFVVLADASSDGSGNLTMTISPPIITSGPHQTVNQAPADGALLTFRGTANTTYRQNLAYFKNAMAMCFVPMEIPQGAVNVSRRTYKGLSVRLIPVYDGVNDLSKWRLDVLYGKKPIDPRKIVRGAG